MNKAGIIICSHLDSKRVKAKALALVNGVPLIQRLIQSLSSISIPKIIAVPFHQVGEYKFLEKLDGVIVEGFESHHDDPLRRMLEAAQRQDISTICRVCHDKIFVQGETVTKWLQTFSSMNIDYMFSSTLQDGTGFEIFTRDILEHASKVFFRNKIEHISYALKAVTSKTLSLQTAGLHSENRLLVDYPEDLNLMEVLHSSLKDDCTLANVNKFMFKNEWARSINKLPKVTIYTCAYNAEKYIEKCIDSVVSQYGFKNYEYIIIDDASTDDTLKHIVRYSTFEGNIKWIKNQKNLGLASSSNIALSEARGKYIIRLDADDFFVTKDAIRTLIFKTEKQDVDVVYPSYYHGDYDKLKEGDEVHHPAGAFFKRSALNHVKFTDALRHYDGLDLYQRAKDTLKIGYTKTPVFFYRQHEESLSKTDLINRATIKTQIEKGVH